MADNDILKNNRQNKPGQENKRRKKSQHNCPVQLAKSEPAKEEPRPKLKINNIDLETWTDSNGNDHISRTTENVKRILQNDPELKGIFAYNVFNECIFVKAAPPWIKATGEQIPDTGRPIRSVDYDFLTHYIEHIYTIKNQETVIRGLNIAAELNRYNPLTEMLDKLQYEPGDHIRHLLPDYLGALDTNYNYEVMKLLLKGAVKRAYEPGCKNDNMPILKGPQNIGKSSFLRMLALDGNYFTDGVTSFKTGKETGEQIQGKWIIEVAELAGMRKADAESLKAFISSQVDRYRPAYAHGMAQDYPRKCVLIGTTNESEYLRDATGNRRYYPITCGMQAPKRHPLDKPGQTIADIKKAIAEVVHEYKQAVASGQEYPLILPQYVCNEWENAKDTAQETDAWADKIKEYLNGRIKEEYDRIKHTPGSYAEVDTAAVSLFETVLVGDIKNMDTRETRRINAVISTMKYKGVPVFVTQNGVKLNDSGKRGRGYRYHATIEQTREYLISAGVTFNDDKKITHTAFKQMSINDRTPFDECPGANAI